jgi:ubiquinol-cytochrome c reductase cytochrome b subunit
VLRFCLILLPPFMFKVTKRFCLGLQHHDEALLHHGVETGIIRMLPHGEYVEVEQPLPADKAAVLAAQIGYDLHGHAALTGSNGHSSNGQAESNGHGQADAPANSSIKKPVALAETARQKLEKFLTEPRESIPDPHAAHDDEDAPTSH